MIPAKELKNRVTASLNPNSLSCLFLKAKRDKNQKNAT